MSAAAPKAKAAKPAPAHPPYVDMIAAAIKALKERTGSSAPAIAKFVGATYKVPAGFEKQLGLQLKRLAAAGKLVKVKASFKLGEALKVRGLGFERRRRRQPAPPAQGWLGVWTCLECSLKCSSGWWGAGAEQQACRLTLVPPPVRYRRRRSTRRRPLTAAACPPPAEARQAG